MLPGDILFYITCFLYWYEANDFCIVNKFIFNNTNREKQKNIVINLQKRVLMACNDHVSFTRKFAYLWGQQIVSYHYAQYTNFEIGSVCEAMDYLGAWSVCTIVDERINTGEPHFRRYLPYTFVPMHEERSTEDIMECGEMLGYLPYFKEYLVRFHGWSNRWNEWVCLDKIRRLGTYTINPWTNSCSFVRQWIIQRKKDGSFSLSIATLKENPKNAFPSTDILVKCLIDRQSHYPIPTLI